MKVLVTGANGMLASSVIQLLIENKITVTGSTRDKNKVPFSSGSLFKLCEGEISDPVFLDNITQGCTHIVHCAALTAQGLTSYKPYYKTNVEITEKLIIAAIKNKVKRFIYISTANTIGYGTFSEPGNERNSMCTPFLNSFYARSKKEAEDILKQYQSKIEIIVINPTFILGSSLNGSGEIIRMGTQNKWILVPPGGKNFVDAREVANGIFRALQNGRPGENYLMAGDNLSYPDFFRKLLQYSKAKQPRLILIPGFLLITAGFFGSCLQLMGIKTRVTLNNMRILCIKSFYTNHKAKAELGLVFSSIDETLAFVTDI